MVWNFYYQKKCKGLKSLVGCFFLYAFFKFSGSISFPEEGLSCEIVCGRKVPLAANVCPPSWMWKKVWLGVILMWLIVVGSLSQYRVPLMQLHSNVFRLIFVIFHGQKLRIWKEAMKLHWDFGLFRAPKNRVGRVTGRKPHFLVVLFALQLVICGRSYLSATSIMATGWQAINQWSLSKQILQIRNIQPQKFMGRGCHAVEVVYHYFWCTHILPDFALEIQKFIGWDDSRLFFYD
jgi:hypothetical protein